MREILIMFWQICLFKKGPEDIPDSLGLYNLSVFCQLGGSLLITKLTMNWPVAIINSLLGFMLLLGFVWVALKCHEKIERFYPTATALFGVDALITLGSVPVFAAVVFKWQPGVAFLFLVLLMLWQWTIMVNILKSALSTSYVVAVGWVIVFILGSFKLLELVSGGG